MKASFKTKYWFWIVWSFSVSNWIAKVLKGTDGAVHRIFARGLPWVLAEWAEDSWRQRKANYTGPARPGEWRLAPCPRQAGCLFLGPTFFLINFEVAPNLTYWTSTVTNVTIWTFFHIEWVDFYHCDDIISEKFKENSYISTHWLDFMKHILDPL